MDGKINEYGELGIFRAGKLKLQDCVRERGQYLCDAKLCPLFSEPEKQILSKTILPDGESSVEYSGRTILNICNQKTLIFDNFSDEREPSA